jgi:hypothetical protein
VDGLLSRAHDVAACSFGWCWFVLREKYCWLVAGGWFVLREKHCWLVADKPNEQAGRSREGEHIVLISVS